MPSSLTVPQWQKNWFIWCLGAMYRAVTRTWGKGQGHVSSSTDVFQELKAVLCRTSHKIGSICYTESEKSPAPCCLLFAMLKSGEGLEIQGKVNFTLCVLSNLVTIGRNTPFCPLKKPFCPSQFIDPTWMMNIPPEASNPISKVIHKQFPLDRIFNSLEVI